MEQNTKFSILRCIDPNSSRSELKKRCKKRHKNEEFLPVHLLSAKQLSDSLYRFCCVNVVEQGHPLPTESAIEIEIAKETGIHIDSDAWDKSFKDEIILHFTQCFTNNNSKSVQPHLYKLWKLFRHSFLPMRELLRILDAFPQTLIKCLENTVDLVESSPSTLLDDILKWILELRLGKDINSRLAKELDTTEFCIYRLLGCAGDKSPQVQEYCISCIMQRDYSFSFNNWSEKIVQSILSETFMSAVRKLYYSGFIQYKSFQNVLSILIRLPRFSSVLPDIQELCIQSITTSFADKDYTEFSKTLLFLLSAFSAVGSSKLIKLYEEWYVDLLSQLKISSIEHGKRRTLQSFLETFCQENSEKYLFLYDSHKKVLGRAFPSSSASLETKPLSILPFLKELPARLKHMDALSMTTHMEHFSHLLTNSSENDLQNTILQIIQTFSACSNVISQRTDLQSKQSVFLHSWSVLFVGSVFKVDSFRHEFIEHVANALSKLKTLSSGQVFVLSYLVGIMEISRDSSNSLQSIHHSLDFGSVSVEKFLQFFSGYLNVILSMREYICFQDIPKHDYYLEIGVIPVKWAGFLHFLNTRNMFICTENEEAVKTISELDQTLRSLQTSYPELCFVSFKDWLRIEIFSSCTSNKTRFISGYNLYLKKVFTNYLGQDHLIEFLQIVLFPEHSQSISSINLSQIGMFISNMYQDEESILASLEKFHQNSSSNNRDLISKQEFLVNLLDIYNLLFSCKKLSEVFLVHVQKWLPRNSEEILFMPSAVGLALYELVNSSEKVSPIECAYLHIVMLISLGRFHTILVPTISKELFEFISAFYTPCETDEICLKQILSTLDKEKILSSEWKHVYIGLLYIWALRECISKPSEMEAISSLLFIWFQNYSHVLTEIGSLSMKALGSDHLVQRNFAQNILCIISSQSLSVVVDSCMFAISTSSPLSFLGQFHFNFDAALTFLLETFTCTESNSFELLEFASSFEDAKRFLECLSLYISKTLPTGPLALNSVSIEFVKTRLSFLLQTISKTHYTKMRHALSPAAFDLVRNLFHT